MGLVPTQLAVSSVHIPRPKYTKACPMRAKRAKQREARKKQTGLKDTSTKDRANDVFTYLVYRY